MRATLGQYITAVRLAIDDLTDGVIDLDDLVDYADGECSLSEMHADNVPVTVAAKRILRENGADWL